MDRAADSQYNTIQEDFKNLELSVGEGKFEESLRDINEIGKRQSVIYLSAAASAAENYNSSSSDSVGGNRRFFLRPRKRTSSDIKQDSDSENFVNLYNVENKRPKMDGDGSKKKNSYLETIFEEPVVKKNGSVMLIGSTKVKRAITFSDFITKTKQKKRKTQIKKYKRRITKTRTLKLSLKDVQGKLDELSSVDFVELR